MRASIADPLLQRDRGSEGCENSVVFIYRPVQGELLNLDRSKAHTWAPLSVGPHNRWIKRTKTKGSGFGAHMQQSNKGCTVIWQLETDCLGPMMFVRCM
jgi:hypothetical protein